MWDFKATSSLRESIVLFRTFMLMHPKGHRNLSDKLEATWKSDFFPAFGRLESPRWLATSGKEHEKQVDQHLRLGGQDQQLSPFEFQWLYRLAKLAYNKRQVTRCQKNDERAGWVKRQPHLY